MLASRVRAHPALAVALAGLGGLALGSPAVAAPHSSARPVGTAALRLRPAADASVMPRMRDPSVIVAPAPKSATVPPANTALGGQAAALMEPTFVDRRRRIPRTARPADFGHLLVPGERFKFDVSFAGNPAGLASAEIVAIEPDPRGRPPAGAPLLKMVGHARTSGIVSLLATVTDDLITVIDARTGAAVSSHNTIHYAGWAPRKYKHRVTDAKYEGRGVVRIVDTKDDKVRKKVKRVPLDTFDPLSAMAWVRSLPLAEGTKSKAHAIDGTTLLRVEIESKGLKPMSKQPTIVRALELGPEHVSMIVGTLTRVDAYDEAIPGKRQYKLRAWVSNDPRRIPLVLESDMWVGSLRLELTSYDPPAGATPP